MKKWLENYFASLNQDSMKPTELSEVIVKNIFVSESDRANKFKWHSNSTASLNELSKLLSSKLLVWFLLAQN